MSDNYVEKLHPEHPECPFVSKNTCADRTRMSKWVVGVFLCVTSVFLGLVVYATGQAQSANTNYIDMHTIVSEHKRTVQAEVRDVKAAFDIHSAEKRAADRSIVEKLEEVKIELSEQRKEQRAVLDKILELQLEVARHLGSENSRNSD